MTGPHLAETNRLAADQSPHEVHPYDWVATIVNISAYVAFMALVYVQPKSWTQEIFPGTGITVGLTCGIGVLLLLIVTSIWHTLWANRRERG